MQMLRDDINEADITARCRNEPVPVLHDEALIITDGFIRQIFKVSKQSIGRLSVGIEVLQISPGYFWVTQCLIFRNEVAIKVEPNGFAQTGVILNRMRTATDREFFASAYE